MVLAGVVSALFSPSFTVFLALCALDHLSTRIMLGSHDEKNENIVMEQLDAMNRSGKMIVMVTRQEIRTLLFPAYMNDTG